MDTPNKKSEQRKRQKIIMVRVRDDEHATITANAGACGYKSLAAYLRDAGQHLKVESRVDQKAVIDLLGTGNDLARLGNLLKLWLSNDSRAKALGKDFDIRRLADELENAKNELYEKVRAL